MDKNSVVAMRHRARGGAQWLDDHPAKQKRGEVKNQPWFWIIDHNILNLFHPDVCVCGQLDGGGENSFYKFLFEHDLTSDQAHELGFWLKDSESNTKYKQLTEIWRVIIERRREAHPLKGNDNGV